MLEIISFVNQNTGFFTVILTMALVIVTLYYAWLTKMMSNNSSKSIEQTKKIIEQTKNEYQNTKNNYLYQLNSELYLNSEIYVMGIHYLSSDQRSTITEKFKLLIQNATSTNPSAVIKAFVREYAKSDIWNEVKNECAKLLPNDLMVELVGYYAGVNVQKYFHLMVCQMKVIWNLQRGNLFQLLSASTY